jgi:hypothetical protein
MPETPLPETPSNDNGMKPPRVLLIGKPDCSLCDAARAVVSAVCGELGESWQEQSLTDDPALADQFWELIPVVLVDGVRHDYWRIDPVRLRAVLTAGD